jgi:hypothetical protein
MRPHGIDLSAWQGVAIDRLVLKHVIDWHNVGLAVVNTAETPDFATSD